MIAAIPRAAGAVLYMYALGSRVLCSKSYLRLGVYVQRRDLNQGHQTTRHAHVPGHKPAAGQTKTEIPPFCPLFFCCGPARGRHPKTRQKNSAMSGFFFFEGPGPGPGSAEAAFSPHFEQWGLPGVFVGFLRVSAFYCGGPARGVYPKKEPKGRAVSRQTHTGVMGARNLKTGE